MFQYLYDWIADVTFYLVIFTALMQLLPNGTYHKYVRFFTGLIMILLVLTPAIKVVGMENTFQALYEEFQTELEEKEMQDLELFENLQSEYETGSEMESIDGWIHVEEIKIGQ